MPFQVLSHLCQVKQGPAALPEAPSPDGADGGAARTTLCRLSRQHSTDPHTVYQVMRSLRFTAP